MLNLIGTAQNAKRGKSMIATAKGSHGTITYSELAGKIKSIKFQPDDHVFHGLLEEISCEENDAGRGMLSVVVVRKRGNGRPAAGFFKLAQELGRDTSERDRCWVVEFEAVRRAWAAR